MLTEHTVRASDRRAQFVGLDAYEQAGGVVLRDLFQHDDGGWLQDVPLLDRMVTEKLRIEAEAIASEGWKWITVAGRAPNRGLRQPNCLRPVARPLGLDAPDHAERPIDHS
jgi:ParB family chromosome partitioning protein